MATYSALHRRFSICTCRRKAITVGYMLNQYEQETQGCVEWKARESAIEFGGAHLHANVEAHGQDEKQPTPVKQNGKEIVADTKYY